MIEISALISNFPLFYYQTYIMERCSILGWAWVKTPLVALNVPYLSDKKSAVVVDKPQLISSISCESYVFDYFTKKVQKTP